MEDFEIILQHNESHIILLISQVEVHIRIFFSMNCCETLFESYEECNDYRIAFANVVFEMFEETTSNHNVQLEKIDFIKSSPKECVNSILAQTQIKRPLDLGLVY